jgi:general secretion pathway protein G
MVVRQRSGHVRGGFTLMEILVVVAIIVVLAGAAVPLYMRFLDQSKVDRARIDCNSLSQMAEAYKLRYGDFPASLDILAQPQQDGSPPYIPPSGLVDPWGRRYEYAPQGQHNALLQKPDIWTQGPKPGDPNGMVGNW